VSEQGTLTVAACARAGRKRIIPRVWSIHTQSPRRRLEEDGRGHRAIPPVGRRVVAPRSPLGDAAAVALHGRAGVSVEATRRRELVDLDVKRNAVAHEATDALALGHGACERQGCRQWAVRRVVRGCHPSIAVVGGVGVVVVAGALVATATGVAGGADAVGSALRPNAILCAAGTVAATAATLAAARMRTISPDAVGRTARAHAVLSAVGADAVVGGFISDRPIAAVGADAQVGALVTLAKRRRGDAR